MDRPSLKKDIINSYWNITGNKRLNNQRLLLVTAAGVISGVPAELPIDAEYDDLADGQVLCKYFHDTVKKYRTYHGVPDSESAPGNDGAITLQDVVITNALGTIDIPFLVVFYDQIIGVSLGNI